MSGLTAVVVEGEAPESEDEDMLSQSPAQTDLRTSSTEDVSRLSLGGLSLSSVRAQVGKQIGVISVGKTAEQTKIHHPTLLHKKLYEKNIIVNNNLNSFFKDLFDKSFEELGRVHSGCFNTSGYLQKSDEDLQTSVQNCRRVEESLSQLCESLASTNLPLR